LNLFQKCKIRLVPVAQVIDLTYLWDVLQEVVMDAKVVPPE